MANPAETPWTAMLELKPPMDASELKYWVAFNRIPRIGRVRFALMESKFGSRSRAWQASSGELSAAGLNSPTAQVIVTKRPTIDPDAELESLAAAGVQAVTWHDDDYPPRLKEIYDLPPVLYVRGELLPADERSLAIVRNSQGLCVWPRGGAPHDPRSGAGRDRHRQRTGPGDRRDSPSCDAGGGRQEAGQ